jgi:DNA-binding XRE family transcriptional regulator
VHFSCSGRLVIPSRLRNIYKHAPSKWLKKHSLAKKNALTCKVCEGDAMKKTFMGVRLKRLREEQRLTQAALAGKLGISLSYLNQLENNQRPLTVPVLLALNSVFGLDVQSFAEGD